MRRTCQSGCVRSWTSRSRCGWWRCCRGGRGSPLDDAGARVAARAAGQLAHEGLFIALQSIALGEEGGGSGRIALLLREEQCPRGRMPEQRQGDRQDGGRFARNAWTGSTDEAARVGHALEYISVSSLPRMERLPSVGHDGPCLRVQGGCLMAFVAASSGETAVQWHACFEIGARAFAAQPEPCV